MEYHGHCGKHVEESSCIPASLPSRGSQQIVKSSKSPGLLLTGLLLQVAILSKKKTQKTEKLKKKTYETENSRIFCGMKWNYLELKQMKTNRKECSRSVPMGIGWKWFQRSFMRFPHSISIYLIRRICWVNSRSVHIHVNAIKSMQLQIISSQKTPDARLDRYYSISFSTHLELWRKKEVILCHFGHTRLQTSAQARSAVFREMVLGLKVRLSRITDITAPLNRKTSKPHTQMVDIHNDIYIYTMMYIYIYIQ